MNKKIFSILFLLGITCSNAIYAAPSTAIKDKTLYDMVVAYIRTAYPLGTLINVVAIATGLFFFILVISKFI